VITIRLSVKRMIGRENDGMLYDTLDHICLNPNTDASLNKGGMVCGTLVSFALFPFSFNGSLFLSNDTLYSTYTHTLFKHGSRSIATSGGDGPGLEL